MEFTSRVAEVADHLNTSKKCVDLMKAKKKQYNQRIG